MLCFKELGFHDSVIEQVSFEDGILFMKVDCVETNNDGYLEVCLRFNNVSEMTMEETLYNGSFNELVDAQILNFYLMFNRVELFFVNSDWEIEDSTGMYRSYKFTCSHLDFTYRPSEQPSDS